jgi:hypothetical protein
MPSVITLPSLYGFPAHAIPTLSRTEDLQIRTNFIFEKSTGMNRMKILGANGPILLSIPVKKHTKGTPASDIQIDYIQKWQNQHWRSIQSAYGKSPYFEYYKAELEDMYARSPERLVDFTSVLMKWILSQYHPRLNISVILAQKPEIFEPSEALLFPWKEDIPASGTDFSYHQVFGEEFVPGLGALDHLFCEGTKFWKLQN